MKNKKGLLFGGLAVLLVITGILVFKTVHKAAPKTATTDQITQPEALPQAPASIAVNLVKSTAKANSIVLSAKGLSANAIVSLAYELSYDSQGLIKGVSGTVLADELKGADTFSREIYLGTCSKNDCKPDLGVTTVSVVLEFTDNTGKKSQFSKDFPLGQSGASGSTNGSATTTPPED